MIKQNIDIIRSQIPSGVTLVAVSKTHSVEDILEAYNAGIRDFAENKVQELLAKQPVLPSDIRWHMIGHLQRNKVKYIAPFIHLIHSVDSEKLLAELQKEAVKAKRQIPVLFEVHIAKEEEKFGFDAHEMLDFFNQSKNKLYPNIVFKGLMGMATFTDDEQQISQEFEMLQNLFKQIIHNHGSNLPHFNELSMGMSSDFLIAMKHGSTLVRIGSSIFGERYYT
jgi:hypothetical protein